MDWSSLTPAETARRQEVEPARGLDCAEVMRRLAEFGPNALPEPPRRGPLRRFLAQFNDVLIYVLLAAGVVTLVLQHWVDAGVIFGVVVINAIVGFVQEGKAEQAMDAIRGMLSPAALVRREGRQVCVGVADLVPGDVVLLAAGDRVPADIRLTDAHGLRIEEAALTGESVPADKGVEAVAPGVPMADRTSIAHSGTLVVAGQGEGVVVATGARTEIGRIGTLLSGVTERTTPLVRQMGAFARFLTVAIVAVSAATFAFGYLVHGLAADVLFLNVVGLAVAAIPEGLPAIMTITLAIGVQRMAARRAIVRRLPAVETLGSVSVICSDKTGTLTRNEMVVRSVAVADGTLEVEGAGYGPDGRFLDGERQPVPAAVVADLRHLLRAAVLCNDAEVHPPHPEAGGDWRVAGDPMEGALLALAARGGVDVATERAGHPRLDLLPFDSAHRTMATLHPDPAGGRVVVIKGAPEALLPRCDREHHPNGPRPLDQAAWQARAEAMASKGERLLAVARLRLPDGGGLAQAAGGGLELLGLLGLADPPREEARAAIAEVQAAGIAVKMITGDHAATAAAIGRQLGLSGAVMTGADLDRLTDREALVEAAASTAVFARTAPEHKLRLVEALQARGAVVAMTGDGVNDAPALKRADVGVAMGGKGTEAAKEASEMVLADDNFATIAAAVEEGRTVYDNLRKSILFILPTNGGQAMVVIAAILFGLVMPLTPKQVLWINMVTAVTLALALAFEAAEKDLMRRPPRSPDTPLLSRYLGWRIVLVSVLLLIVTVTGFQWALAASGGDEHFARTMAVNALVAGEIAYLWNARFLRRTALSRDGLLGSRPVLLAVGLVILLQLGFTYLPPAQFLFDTRPLGWDAWGMVLAGGLFVFVVVEVEKAVMRAVDRRAASSATVSHP